MAVRSARLALGWLKPGGLQPLPLTADGWWLVAQRRCCCLAWRIPSGDNSWRPWCGPRLKPTARLCWRPCPELAVNAAGKWQRGQWREWLGGR
ncbi:MAG: hypothetical protein NTY67_02685 [Cyanobacteria bacterium]|nr:hypothetical protein [Cyanobacteriota bacterium]